MHVRRNLTGLLLILWSAVIPAPVFGWSNGPAGNATTDTLEECANPPYATHDWIADHAMALLPQAERTWLEPHKALYLLGTEAPDNREIPLACGAPFPHVGYDDRRKGHSVEWSSDGSTLIKDRAAQRAQEEYDKAGRAFNRGDPAAAAFYLGAMAHYIGDVSQYGHTIPFEDHHSDFENWAKSRTDSFQAGHFESYIQGDTLVRRRAYTAAKRISKITAHGKDRILSAAEMDAQYSHKGQAYFDSVGLSLNLAVNELADVLHTFYLNVVSDEE